MKGEKTMTYERVVALLSQFGGKFILVLLDTSLYMINRK